MRTLTLIEPIELQFRGSMLPNALCFGDCDNDGLDEFILGNTSGDLFIYRDVKCIGCASELGTVCAIAVGDLLNIKRNVLVVVTVEGWCHLFDVQYDLIAPEKPQEATEAQPQRLAQAQTQTQKETETETPAQVPLDYSIIVPFHSQRIVCNVKSMLLGDVNQDGVIELIVGLTDRVLRTYQWRSEYSSDDQPKRRYGDQTDLVDGRLYAMKKWEFATQIGSIALHKHGSVVSILVGQPGGTVTQITERDTIPVQNTASHHQLSVGSGSSTVLPASHETIKSVSTTKSFGHGPSVDKRCHVEAGTADIIEDFLLDLSQMRNKETSSEVVGNVYSHTTNTMDSYAVASADGTVLIAKQNEIEWSAQLEIRILRFFQHKGSLIFACCDGDMYILPRKFGIRKEDEIIKFNLDEDIAAFGIGSYACKDDIDDSFSPLVNKPMMAFITFSENIYLYSHDLLQ